jgi:FixJ family two-component response regulator
MTGNGHLISVVDDDRCVREALADLLQSAGLEVATFASAEEFLGSEHLRTAACVILDLQMPGMGGLALQQRLARDGHPIPIVILTAHGDDDARAQALAQGAVAFMRKPFDGESLLRAVEAALKRGLTGH